MRKKKSSFKKKRIINGKEEMVEFYSLLVYYTDEDLKFFSYLPAMDDDMADEDVAALQDEIIQKKPSSICHYGNHGQRQLVKIHQFGECNFFQLIRSKTLI